jgi:hypothetical protein
MKSITRFTKNIRGNKCLNCENDISEEDNFCSRCGQVNDLKKVSLKQYLSAYFDDFLSFDSRFLNTIVGLVFKPGYVTKNYVEGKRMRYMNPFRLYIQITILFFLVVGIFSTIDNFKSIDEQSYQLIPELNLDQGKANLDDIKSETLNELRKKDVVLDSATLSLIDNGIQNISQNKDSIQDAHNSRKALQTKMLFNFIDSIAADNVILEKFKDESIQRSEKDSAMNHLFELIGEKAGKLTGIDQNIKLKSAFSISMLWQEISVKGNIERQGVKYLDSIFHANKIDYEIPLKMVYRSKENKGGFNNIKTFIDYQNDYPTGKTSEALKKLGFEPTYWNGFLFNKSKEWADAFDDEDYWKQILDRVLSRISVALFFLLPIFTLIVSLLYIRRKFNYTENLVFVFHIQTVFFLLLLIFLIVDRIVDTDIGILIFTLTFMIYLYKAMRNFYGQGWFKTLLKYVMLNMAFLFLALLGGLIISFLAFLI